MGALPPQQPGPARPISDLDLLFAAAHDDLATFTGLAFTAVEPGNPYLPNWHVWAIAYALERWHAATASV